MRYYGQLGQRLTLCQKAQRGATHLDLPDGMLAGGGVIGRDYRPQWCERLLGTRPEILAQAQVRFAAAEFRIDSIPSVVASAGK